MTLGFITDKHHLAVHVEELELNGSPANGAPHRSSAAPDLTSTGARTL
jgi:hypothetical protein